MDSTQHSTKTQAELDRDEYAARYHKTDWAVYGKSYLVNGLRLTEQRRRRQEIGVRHREFTPQETARAEECRKILAEQTSSWSPRAPLFMERQTEVKLKQESRKASNASYEDCGQEIDAEYIKCVINILKWAVTIFLA